MTESLWEDPHVRLFLCLKLCIKVMQSNGWKTFIIPRSAELDFMKAVDDFTKLTLLLYVYSCLIKSQTVWSILKLSVWHVVSVLMALDGKCIVLFCLSFIDQYLFLWSCVADQWYWLNSVFCLVYYEETTDFLER